MANGICIVDASQEALDLNSTTLKRTVSWKNPAAAPFLLAAEEGVNFTQDNDTASAESLSWGVTRDSQADPLH